jgi:hypothetical protein
MPQSVSKVIIHIIFSIKDREAWLDRFLHKYGVEFDERYVWD